MAKEFENAEHREEGLELEEPLLRLESEQERREQREKTIASLRLLWHRRAFLARSGAVGLALAALIAFLIPNGYTSTARLMPPEQGPGGGAAMLAALAEKAGGPLGGIGAQALGLKTTDDLFIGILQSRTVEDDLIAKFNLRQLYGDKRWEDARKELSKLTSIFQDRKSEIITISVNDRSPSRAQQMAQEYVTELNNVVINLNTSSAHRERVFLAGRLTQVQQNLEAAEKQFSQFASQNTAVDIQEQSKAMIEAGASLEGQLIAAQTEIEGLRQIYTDSNVRVRETRARIDEIERQLHKLGGTAPDDTNDPPSNDPPSNESDSLYPTIRQLPILGVTYADLYRQTKVQEAVFEALTQEYELAKVEEVKETPSVKVLDPADIPEKKSSPQRLLMVLGGMFLGGAFGTAWLLGKAKWQQIDEHDPAKALGIEVLDSIRAYLPATSRNGSSGDEAPSERPADQSRNSERADARAEEVRN